MVKKIKETLSIQIPKLGNTYKLILYFDDYYYTAPWFILHKFTRSRFSERLCVVFNQWHWEVYVINTWLSQITKYVARSTLAVETLSHAELAEKFFLFAKGCWWNVVYRIRNYKYQVLYWQSITVQYKILCEMCSG